MVIMDENHPCTNSQKRSPVFPLPRTTAEVLKLDRFRIEEEFLCSPSMSRKILLKESDLCP